MFFFRFFFYLWTENWKIIIIFFFVTDFSFHEHFDFIIIQMSCFIFKLLSLPPDEKKWANSFMSSSCAMTYWALFFHHLSESFFVCSWNGKPDGSCCCIFAKIKLQMNGFKAIFLLICYFPIIFIHSVLYCFHSCCCLSDSWVMYTNILHSFLVIDPNWDIPHIHNDLLLFITLYRDGFLLVFLTAVNIVHDMLKCVWFVQNGYLVFGSGNMSRHHHNRKCFILHLQWGDGSISGVRAPSINDGDFDFYSFFLNRKSYQLRELNTKSKLLLIDGSGVFQWILYHVPCTLYPVHYTICQCLFVVQINWNKSSNGFQMPKIKTPNRKMTKIKRQK